MHFTLFEELADISVGTWICIAVFIAAVAAGAVLLSKRQTKPVAVNTHRLVYGALCVAVAFVLSYIRLFSLGQGGSVTLASMLPIALYASWYGVGPGFICGLVYGLLQFLQKPEIVHWVQPILDYFLGFAMIGLAGLFPKKLWLGVLAGGLGRWACSTVSGAVFFGEWAWEGWSVWGYSAAYNALTIGVDAVLCAVIAALPPVRKALERLRPKQS